MQYRVTLLIMLMMLAGCNNGSSTSSDADSVNNAPQPQVKNRELQPPKPPSL